MVGTILFPSSLSDPNSVDEELAQEYAAVRETGLFRVILFSCDDWFKNGELRLSEKPGKEISAVYRGWMMKTDMYRDFYIRLLENNISLITDPDMYTLMNIFPNVYPHLSPDCARILTFPLHARIDIETVKAVFDRFSVRDYMKTAMDKQFRFYFGPSVTQEEFDSWMHTFYDYDGNSFTGDVFIKEYLNLKRRGGKTNEFRVFYVNHQIASVAGNSGQASASPEPPVPLIEKYKNLDSVFYSLDFAELENGFWKIIEAGDGSVSGLPEGQDNAAFFRRMHQILNPAGSKEV